MNRSQLVLLGGFALGGLVACREEAAPVVEATKIEGATFVVADTVVGRVLKATGSARPHLEAVLSTRLMGTVLTVSVQEGERVRKGQALLRVDGRDIDARASGIASGLEASRSQLSLAEAQVKRMRALYADSAVAKSALDQAETELDRARAGMAMTSSQDAELKSVMGYSRLVAPFAGRIVSRMVDPGMMAAPGQPLLGIEDASLLRVGVTTTTETARMVEPGTILRATVDGMVVSARVEGVVPSGSGNLSVVNALIENGKDSIPSGAVATLELPRGERTIRAVPASSLFHEGDLVGVWVRGPSGDGRRWIRVGEPVGDLVEVLSGLRVGDTVVVPAAPKSGI